MVEARNVPELVRCGQCGVRGHETALCPDKIRIRLVFKVMVSEWMRQRLERELIQEKVEVRKVNVGWNNSELPQPRHSHVHMVFGDEAQALRATELMISRYKSAFLVDPSVCDQHTRGPVCFRCQQPGHVARLCPKAASVPARNGTWASRVAHPNREQQGPARESATSPTSTLSATMAPARSESSAPSTSSASPRSSASESARVRSTPQTTEHKALGVPGTPLTDNASGHTMESQVPEVDEGESQVDSPAHGSHGALKELVMQKHLGVDPIPLTQPPPVSSLATLSLAGSRSEGRAPRRASSTSSQNLGASQIVRSGSDTSVSDAESSGEQEEKQVSSEKEWTVAEARKGRGRSTTRRHKA